MNMVNTSCISYILPYNYFDFGFNFDFDSEWAFIIFFIIFLLFFYY